MSAIHNIYQAPDLYPIPPKNTWYQVPPPQVTAEQPKPLLAWETNQAKPPPALIKNLKPNSRCLAPLVENDEEDECDIEEEAERLVDMACTDDRLEYLLKRFPRLTMLESAELSLHHQTVHTLLHYSAEQEARKCR
jgi:hypothetical protein